MERRARRGEMVGRILIDVVLGEREIYLVFPGKKYSRYGSMDIPIHIERRYQKPHLNDDLLSPDIKTPQCPTPSEQQVI
jgi:hypothetical protein